MVIVVGNRDRCGRCHTRHGGNDHTCRVHGAVSEECCPVSCLPPAQPATGAQRKREFCRHTWHVETEGGDTVLTLLVCDNCGIARSPTEIERSLWVQAFDLGWTIGRRRTPTGRWDKGAADATGW